MFNENPNSCMEQNVTSPRRRPTLRESSLARHPHPPHTYRTMNHPLTIIAYGFTAHERTKLWFHAESSLITPPSEKRFPPGSRMTDHTESADLWSHTDRNFMWILHNSCGLSLPTAIFHAMHRSHLDRQYAVLVRGNHPSIPGIELIFPERLAWIAKITLGKNPVVIPAS